MPAKDSNLATSMIGRRDGDGIVPHHDAAILTDFERMKIHLKKCTKMERRKLIAWLGAHYSTKILAQVLEMKPNYIAHCKYYYPDIVESAQMSRLTAISELSQKRQMELLQSMDVGKISDDKKAQSVRNLADADQMVYERIKPKDEKKDENVMELYFKVTRSLKKKEPIEVEAEVVEEVKPQIEEAK